jgi:hypothetical protein
MEVHLGLGRRQVRLRHKALLQRPTASAAICGRRFADVITHRRIRQIRRTVLVHQPRQNPSRGVTLLLRRLQIAAQHRVDRRLKRL